MSSPDQRPPADPEAPVEPLDVDPVPVVAIGTALWFAAFVVLLVLRDRLVAGGDERWIWTCLAGAGLGLVGLSWCLRRGKDASRPGETRDDEAPYDLQ